MLLTNGNKKQMRNFIFLIITLAFTLQLKAQNYKIPPNPKAGKCYKKCFYYEKEVEWEELDCESYKAELKKEKTPEELKKSAEEIIKMKKYQEKLITLGYDLNISGIADNKTISAHHKYLKKKRKEDKRKKRAEKRKAKSD